jgi:hypothetical protein
VGCVDAQTSEAQSSKRKVDVVGPDDIAKGDVDLPRHAMCHHLGW